MASPTPSLESRANSLGSLASLSPLTVSGSSPPASDSAICDVDSCDLCLDAQLGNKPGDPACPRCHLVAPSEVTSVTHQLLTSSVVGRGGSSASSTSSHHSDSLGSSASSSTSGTGSASGLLTAASSSSNLSAGIVCIGSSSLSVNSTTFCSASKVGCTGCKSNESGAVARCYDCANFLCPNCVMAHQFMHCFEGHRVLNLTNGSTTVQTNGASNNGSGSSSSSPSSSSMESSVIGSLKQHQTNNEPLTNGQSNNGGTGSPNGITNNNGINGNINNINNNNNNNNNESKSNGQQQQQQSVVQSLVANSLFLNGVTSNGTNGGGNGVNQQQQQQQNHQQINGEKSLICARHKGELLKFYCRSCSVPLCKECTISDHQSPMHDYVHVSEIGPQLLESVSRAVQECRAKVSEIRTSVKTADHGAAKLQVQYHKAQNEINETFQFYRSMLEERKQELLKELESIFSAKQISLGVSTQKANDMVDKIQQTCDFVERVSKCSNVLDVLMVKKLLDGKLQMILNYSTDLNAQTTDLEFVSNYQAIQVGVRNTFGYVRSSNNCTGPNNCDNQSCSGPPPNKQPPIARPSASLNQQMTGNHCPGSGSSSASSGPGSAGSLGGLLLDRPYSNGLISAAAAAVSGSNCPSGGSQSPFESTGSVISKRFSSANSLGPFSTSISELSINGMNNPYEKWSNGGSDPYPGVSVTNNDHGFQLPASVSASSAPVDSVLDLTSKLMPTAAIFPLKSQIKRQKMIYHCKFGEFGVMEGQFTEPSGVAVNAQNDIIVADTNNHRIQIFDKEGRFKFQFGECGKRDGQLLYPNRVAVVRTSGDIIVTERSPTHQIQIYNQYGQFVRKFGANILQHPRGVTVDSKGRIVVVECKVMRVIIFDQAGNVLQKFGCSKHLEFPNGVVVNDKQEIFISDNRAHCVKVFNYEGAFIRQIGGEGITNYPIGVGINSAGEILIADNHNNFNLTIFTQDGNLVSALESKVKHAQCFDVALMDDGSVVLASKDYRLYIYRYVQVPPIGI